MDPVNSLNQIIGLLRQRMTDKPGKTNRKTLSGLTTSSREALPKPGINELQQNIRNRISSLSDEERNSDKGTLIFVESVLTWEFGEEVLNDPAFTSMTEDILQSINTNQELRDSFNRLLSSF